MSEDASGAASGLRDALLDANQRLQDYASRVRRALTIDTVGVLFFRLDERITDANEAFARMSGYTRDELLRSVRWSTLTAPEFHEITRRATSDLATRGDTAPFETLMVRKDGSRWWGLAAPKRIARSGVDSECVEFVIDITERHEAEARLREKEACQAYLVHLGDALRELTDPVGIQTTAARVLCEHLAADRTLYGETGDAADSLEVAREYQRRPASSAAGSYAFAAFPGLHRRIASGRTVVIEDVEQAGDLLSGEREAIAALDVNAFVATPLIKAGRYVAMLAVSAERPRKWTEADVRAIAETAERTWAAVERARAEARLQRTLDELDDRVRERTSELAAANAALEREVDERRAAETRITGLFKRLVNAHEEERRAVARDIHDQLGQQMTALRMNLEALRGHVEADPLLSPQVERVQRLAEEVDSSVDTLTWQLRPSALDHLGLSAALAHLVNGWSERFHVHATYESVGVDGLRFEPEIQTHVYRLVQEALHNVFKHAQATDVGVMFERRGNRAVVVIEDNGRGFDPAHPRPRSSGGGLGLVGMRERARLIGGDVEVESLPGQGTTVFVRVPVPVERNAAT